MPATPSAARTPVGKTSQNRDNDSAFQQLGFNIGWCIWSAGEVLADYLASRPDLFQGKACLELGAGVGAVGNSRSLLEERQDVYAQHAR